MRRLTYSLIFVLLLSTIGLSWLVDSLYQYTENPSQDVDKVKLFEQLGENIAQTLQQLESRQTFISNWQASHQYLLNQHHIDELALPDSILTQIQTQQFLLLTTDSQLSYYHLLTDNTVMVLSAPIELFEPSADNSQYLYTLLFYGLLLSAFLLWAYPLLKQLNRLQASAKAFGKGELSQRVKSHQLSYIQDIEQEFNRMAQRIEDLIGDIKLLGNAVSHELRTPLARIRFGLDTLAEEEDAEQRVLYQEKINQNLDEMTDLVESLLGYARIEQTMINLTFTPIDLVSLLEKIAANYRQDNVTVNTSFAQHSVYVLGDEQYLSILINNLIINAVRYGQGEVLIEINLVPEQVEMIIHDNGNGIPATQQQNIFKPFIRANQNKSKGFGLGLAIVKRIVDWHKGNIQVGHSSKLGGAAFTVLFPINQKSK